MHARARAHAYAPAPEPTPALSPALLRYELRLWETLPLNKGGGLGITLNTDHVTGLHIIEEVNPVGVVGQTGFVFK